MTAQPTPHRARLGVVVRPVAIAVACAALLAAGGCATTGAGASAPATAAQRTDPWEAWNRKVFAFNDAVDDAVLKPVAIAYRDAVPELVRTGVDNVFGNIRDVWSAANHLLQGKVFAGLDMGMRVLTNTLFGLGGLLDPATEFGLERRSEDFGQTLGRWGFPRGPYVVLPLFGPSTVRDTGGLLVDRQAAPAALPPTESGRYAVAALELVNTRANLLQTTDLLGGIALDRYTFVRDAYLAARRNALYDGSPPLEDFDDDWADEPAAAAAPARPASGVPPSTSLNPQPPR